jgi:hypothetical protein
VSALLTHLPTDPYEHAAIPTTPVPNGLTRTQPLLITIRPPLPNKRSPAKRTCDINPADPETQTRPIVPSNPHWKAMTHRTYTSQAGLSRGNPHATHIHTATSLHQAKNTALTNQPFVTSAGSCDDRSRQHSTQLPAHGSPAKTRFYLARARRSKPLPLVCGLTPPGRPGRRAGAGPRGLRPRRRVRRAPRPRAQPALRSPPTRCVCPPGSGPPSARTGGPR